jgi:hypothetical protein
MAATSPAWAPPAPVRLDQGRRGDLSQHQPADDQRSIARAFIAEGQHSRWRDAPAYLLRALPDHAVAGGRIDDLLIDDSYLLHADLRRLIPASYHAVTAELPCGVG